MTRLVIATVVVALALSLFGCAGPHSRENAGTVLGGVAGGVLGSQIGDGHGRTAAIIAGTIVGAVVGKEVGRSIDHTDELQAQQALETNKTGQSSTWVNPDTNSQVTVTPTRTYQVANNDYCREYTTEVNVGGERHPAYGTACRRPDGSWKVVN
jgi:surface antigen